MLGNLSLVCWSTGSNRKARRKVLQATQESSIKAVGGRGEGLEKNYRKCLTLDQFLDLFAVYLAIKIRGLEEVPPDVYNKEFCGWVILEYDSPNPCSPIQGSSSIQFCLEYYKFICLHILPTFFFFPGTMHAHILERVNELICNFPPTIYFSGFYYFT